MRQKFICLLLVFAIIIGIMPAVAFADTEPISAAITFSAQKDGEFLAMRNSITVADGIAEEYGYTVAVSDHNGIEIAQPTVFDALVAVHKAKYGDLFTKETAKDYLDINGSGTLTKAFEESAYTTGFFVNGEMSNDGIEGKYGTTGYSIDAARLVDNDLVEFWFYQDTEYYSDYYTFFEETEISAEVNHEVILNLKGFMIMSAMGYTPTVSAISGEDGTITVNEVKGDGSLGEALVDGTGNVIGVSESGQIKICFDKEGTYIITANGFEAEYGSPIFAPWCRITVNKANEDNKPRFESLEFLTSALASGTWIAGETFSPAKLEYDLLLSRYSVSDLSLKDTTKYDTEKYDAIAEYKNADGEDVSVKVNSGASTAFKNLPFDKSVIEITVYDKENDDLKTTYVFNITRPRDTAKTLSKIIMLPFGRSLNTTKYNDYSEGTFFKADESGALTSGTGVSASQYYYRTFLQNLDVFKLEFTGSTKYAHFRYKVDDGQWTELSGQVLQTDLVTIPAEKTDVCITVELIDDKTYTDNIKNGADSFTGDTAKYYIWVEKAELNNREVQISDGVTDFGEWYPEFSSDNYTYSVIVPKGTEALPIFTFKAFDGSKVMLGNSELTANDGLYSVTLSKSAQTITVTSQDGSLSNSYSIKALERSDYDVPDRVVDYLCIGSNYTNSGFGIQPEYTLSASLKSLGNFGGYITYYYDTPVVNNPKNLYGIDFYVYGNNFQDGGSGAEIGQVYVSEDGEKWYALAGSEHYEKTAHRDYTITYTKGEDGKSYWTDSLGNEMSNSAKAWPMKAYYYMNDVADCDTYTYTGIVFDSIQGTVIGDSSTSSLVCPISFGYADYYGNGKIGVDVNPYIENPERSNGFDLEWAVDDQGNPIDVSDKEFHYIKVATASNIWAGSLGEKSTEVTAVVRTSEQAEAVGRTEAAGSVIITDGINTKKIVLSDEKQIYDINLGDMKYISVGVNGIDEGSNVYINNQRIAYGEKADGFKVTIENGVTLVRVIVQNGDMEPRIYLLRLSGEATETDELIEGIKASVGGNVKRLETKDGKNYLLTVGNRISEIELFPIVNSDVSILINGSVAEDKCSLEYGKNIFTITADDGNGKTCEVMVTVTRESPSSVSGSDSNITVYFTLLGDEKHGTGKIHTYKSKTGLVKWIKKRAVTVEYGSTVLDVFDKALKEANLSYTNDGGNYISEINGLAEFDNGSLSGWMYLINNKYSDYGIDEYSVKNGDDVVFHYTDDYTAESSSVSSSGNSGKPTQSNSGKNNNEEQKSNDENIPEATDKADSDYITVPFGDVSKADWFCESVANIYNLKIMKGISEHYFAPNENATRAMFITALHRLEKEPETSKNAFSDVDKSEYYYVPVMWANENQIVNGTSETEFSPNEKITREQIAVILYRYTKYKGGPTDADKSFDLSKFGDAEQISDYSAEAMEWACRNGIYNGYDDGKLYPKQLATRAEIAVILTRFINFEVR